VAKTKTRTSGRVSNRFWKLLGASTDKDQSHSMAQGARVANRREGAADLVTLAVDRKELGDVRRIARFVRLSSCWAFASS